MHAHRQSCGCLRICMSTHVYVETRSQCQVSYCVAFHFIVLKLNISLNLIHMDSVGWLASGLRRSFCLHPPELGLKMCAQLLIWVLRHWNSGPHACVSRTVLTKLLPLQPFSNHCSSLQKSKTSKRILCIALFLVIYTSSVKELDKNLHELKSLFFVLCGFVDPIYL